MRLFSYDSKFSQIMLKLCYGCYLNLLWLVCSLPVFTAGAATAALYDIITTRVLLGTRHPERSKVDIHDGCVRFYDMEWSDRMSLLLKMGLISMDEVTSFPKPPEDK